MKTLDIFTDEEVNKYNEMISNRGVVDIIEKTFYEKYKELIEQNIRPEKPTIAWPSPPFRYYLEKEVDPLMVLDDVNPEAWGDLEKKLKMIHRALYLTDEEVPPWEPFTPLQYIAYFLAYHVYDEFNSHPVLIDLMKRNKPIVSYPKYAVPIEFYTSPDDPHYPWDAFMRGMIDTAYPYLEEFMKTLTPHHQEHGWLVRFVFMGEPKLYEICAPLHDELRTALPPDKVSEFLENTGNIIVFKRAFTKDFKYLFEEFKPGSYEYELHQWMTYKRDTYPRAGIDYTFSHYGGLPPKNPHLEDDEDDDFDDDEPKKKASKKPTKKVSKPTNPNKTQPDALF